MKHIILLAGLALCFSACGPAQSSPAAINLPISAPSFGDSAKPAQEDSVHAGSICDVMILFQKQPDGSFQAFQVDVIAGTTSAISDGVYLHGSSDGITPSCTYLVSAGQLKQVNW